MFSVPFKTSGLSLGPTKPTGSFVLAFFLGIKRPGPESNNSPVSSAEVMLLSTKFPLDLRLQLNEQQKLKALRVCRIDSTVKCKLVGVQIDTGMLVKGSVWK